MRKLNILLVIALAAAMLASFMLGHVGTVSAQEVPPTGVVVEYLPGQSITIVDQSSTQYQYAISASVRILPPVRSNALAVGSFVTIIAPASLTQGKQMAVGIVVHPHVPPGWNMPVMTSTTPDMFTPLPTGTPPATDTTIATITPTGTQLATDMATETPSSVETATDTPTTTATAVGGGSALSPDAFLAWLRSLFQQVITR